MRAIQGHTVIRNGDTNDICWKVVDELLKGLKDKFFVLFPLRDYIVEFERTSFTGVGGGGT